MAGKHVHWGKILGFSGFHGRENLGLKKSCGCKKLCLAAEGGRKILAFFFGANLRFKWENDKKKRPLSEVKFWAFTILMDVRFSVFQGV